MSSFIAITRPVSQALANCELSFVDRQDIDIQLARQQHQNYLDTLKKIGCEIVPAPVLDEQADAVFVEDTALVTDQLAIITRPGAVSRRQECASIAALLQDYRPLAHIAAPGTVDGGDLLLIGQQLYVGLSARTNPAGIAQLQTLLAPQAISVHTVRTQGCLHLKSAVTALDDETVLIQPKWLVDDPFQAYRRVVVDATEEHAANALRIGTHIVLPASFPKTAERIQHQGFTLDTVDVSELQKAEGATTCCSIVFKAQTS